LMTGPWRHFSPLGARLVSVHLRTPSAETGRTVLFTHTCRVPQADLF